MRFLIVTVMRLRFLKVTHLAQKNFSTCNKLGPVYSYKINAFYLYLKKELHLSIVPHIQLSNLEEIGKWLRLRKKAKATAASSQPSAHTPFYHFRQNIAIDGNSTKKGYFIAVYIVKATTNLWFKTAAAAMAMREKTSPKPKRRRRRSSVFNSGL